jgi:hypothetical protein
MKAFAVVLAFFYLFSTSPRAAQAQHIEKLVISSSWGGLGKPGRSSITVEHKDDHYLERGRRVPVAKMAFLESALKAPVLTKPDLDNLGISTEWLASHFPEVLKYTTYFDYEAGLPAQQKLFRTAFVDEKTIQRRIERLYKSFHTDDYPQIKVDLTFDDGIMLVVSSVSQNPYMIPWSIQRNGSKSETYNANISRALFDILPENFTNSFRLTDEGQFAMGMLPELARYTASDVKAQWETLGAENRAGDAIGSLKSQYLVRNSSVNSYHNLDYGTKWDTASSPHEENLHADLRRTEWPTNFYLAAVLLHHGQQTEGADNLLRDASKYENLVFSIPWIRKYYDTHSDVYSWLFFVHDRSFSEKAMRIFADDMKEVGHEDLIPRVKAVQEQVALLEDDKGDFWIILPDKSAVLWRVDSLTNVMNWSYSQFPTHRCTDYQTSSGGCSGTVLSSEGEIVH